MGLIKDGTLWLASGIEGAAALIVALAAAEATLRAVLLYATGIRRHDIDDAHDRMQTIRLTLGRWLTLALEFALAADILRTAIAPSWDEIGKLAAIATLRTALNFFLQREVDGERARRARD